MNVGKKEIRWNPNKEKNKKSNLLKSLDSEVAYSTDQSTRILRFGKLGAEGGLRKIITYQTQRHQHCRKEETERQPHQRLDRALPKHAELWCGPCVNVEGKTFGEATDAQ